MGISIDCHGLSHVVDNLFADLKWKYVFNYLDDLAEYSASISEHHGHLKEILRRLQSAGFMLNKEMVLGASEIKHLGHYLSSRGIRAILDRGEAIRQYPCPRNVCGVFLRWLVFMLGLFLNFQNELLHCRE
jgi:hypothetical protein